MLFISMAPELVLQPEPLSALVALIWHYFMYEASVQLQSRSLHETLFAAVTLVGMHTDVQLLVALQVTLVSEELFTLSTLVDRLGVRVHAFHVQPEGGGVEEGVAALGADATLLPRMSKPMQLELGSASGREGAHVAVPGLSVRPVDATMLLQRAFQRENLVALLAPKAIFGRGHLPVTCSMALERQRCDEVLVAVRAGERPLTCVLAHVVEQVEAPVERQVALRAALDTLRVAALVRHVHVVGQPAGPAKLLAALLALVRLDGGTRRGEVSAHVQTQVRLCPEALQADVAREGGG